MSSRVRIRSVEDINLQPRKRKQLVRENNLEAPLRIDQKYKKIKKIGHGAFGEAFTVKCFSNCNTFVLKIEKLETQMRRKRVDEIKALKKCNQ